MNEKEYLSRLGKSKVNRILALISVVLIVGLIIATLICGVMGSPYFLGLLALTIIVPMLLYAMLFIGKVLAGLNTDNKPEEKALEEQEK